MERWEGKGLKAIPVSVRERILKLSAQGKSTQEIADLSGYCVAAVRRVRQPFKARGTLEPPTHLCGRKTLLTAPRQARLQQLVGEQPAATLAELGARLDRPFRTSPVDLWLRRLGLSYKKNAARRRTTPPRRGRTTGALARRPGGGTRRTAGVRG